MPIYHIKISRHTISDLLDSFDTSKPMKSLDINLKEGIPTSPSYVGFGESIIPNGLNKTNMISVDSDTADWMIEIKYIKVIISPV